MNKADIERQAKAPTNDMLLLYLYAACLSGADFLRTQMSEADVCRTALRRAWIAARVWTAKGIKEADESGSL